jgi:hypothetical protein
MAAEIARSRARVFAALAVFGAMSFAPKDSFAFCRTTTVSKPADNNPGVAADCQSTGFPVFWRNLCVGYSIQKDGSQFLNNDEAAEALSRAFQKWSDATCGTDGMSKVSIDVKNLGPVTCGEVAFHEHAPNQNVIVYRDNFWPHPDPRNETLALTTVTYDKTNGEILDADMEINSYGHPFSFRDPLPPGAYDFNSVVTHEAGHFLGLAHSPDPTAVMYFQEPPATNKRTLTDDDLEGICTIYRADGNRSLAGDKVTLGTKCDPTPINGFSTMCVADPPAYGSSPSAGCGAQVAPGDTRGRLFDALGFAAGALAFFAARKRRARPAQARR